MNKETAIAQIVANTDVDIDSAELILRKAKEGGEVAGKCYESWLNERFLPNIVKIDLSDYTRMCVDALKILGNTAATDYGSSRQRDLGQLWADMTRGYLGEIAVKNFLKAKWDIDITLGHEIGELVEYLPTDIEKIKDSSGKFRQANLKVSIKATKWNGIWLDIPGDQFNHSDIHLMTKVHTGRDHLFAFFKVISVFKDKVLKKGIEEGAIDETQAGDIFTKLPDFKPIVAYIAGFAEKGNLLDNPRYELKVGPKHATINAWNGEINANDLEIIKKEKNIQGQIKFSGIGRFSHDSGYLFNTGNLRWCESDWEGLVRRL